MQLKKKKKKNDHKLIAASLNSYYKTSHCLPHVGTRGFEGISLKTRHVLNKACFNFLSPGPTNHLQSVDRYLNQGSR